MSVSLFNKLFYGKAILSIFNNFSEGLLTNFLRPNSMELAPIGVSLDEESATQNWDIFSNNGMLLAVPKKKVSHMKKRQRLYAPGKKQLKLMHNLNKCPSCGHYKMANTLCTYCVDHIRHIWKAHTVEKPTEPLQEQELSELDKRLIYPGKKDTPYQEKLKDKDSYLKRKVRSLPVDDK